MAFEQITLDNCDEYEVHKFSAMASDLGFKPGEWPERLSTSLGNKLDLMRRSKQVKDNDLQWVTYVQAAGCISLRIYND